MLVELKQKAFDQTLLQTQMHSTVVFRFRCKLPLHRLNLHFGEQIFQFESIHIEDFHG